MKDTPETVAEETGTDLVTLEQSQIILAFTEDAIDPLVKRIEEEVALHQPDLSTDKGRKAIKSLAFKVARSKTLLDETGKDLTEEARAKIEKVNAQRRLIRERLDDLKATVRRPLEIWEAKEEARKDARRKALMAFSVDRTSFDMPVTDIQAVIDEVAAIEVDDSWEEFRAMAEEGKTEALEKFGRDLAAASIREEQARKIAELEAAAKAQREKEEREAAERAQKEAEERAKVDAAEAEARQEAERKAREEERARLEAEEAARAEQAKFDRAEGLIAYVAEVAKGTIGGSPQPYGILAYEIDQKVPQEKAKVGEHWPRVEAAIEKAKSALDEIRKAEEVAAKEEEARREQERQAAAEAERQEREAEHQRQLAEAQEAERQRAAEEKRKEEEARAKRAADAAHRKRVLSKVAEAMSAFPIEKLPQAILDGKIPHVRMEI